MDIRIISFAALAGFVLASFFTFSSTIVHADNHNSPKDKVRPEYDMMQKNRFNTLNLTDNQRMRINAIHKSYQLQLTTINSSILALDKQHQILDKPSPDYAIQVKMIATEKARLMQMQKSIKDKIHQNSMHVLSKEQRIEMKVNTAKDKSNMR